MRDERFKKKILTLGVQSCNKADIQNAETVVRNLGNNTGNILFSEALSRRYPKARHSSYHFSNEDGEWADVVIVAAANWLNPFSDFGDLALRLEKLKKPIHLVGVGIQPPPHGKITLKAGTRHLVDLASTTTANISTRGAQTAEFLDSIGIKNAMPTGCPSLLLHNGKFSPPHLFRPTSDDLTITGTRHLWNRSNSIQKGFYRFAYREKCDIVLQSETPDICLALNSTPKPQETHDYAEILKDSYGSENLTSIRVYLRNHGNVFFNIEDWKSYLRDRRFCIGTRIHGAIMAIIAGVTTIIVTHDTRTREMAECMCIPHVDIKQGEDVSWDWIWRSFEEAKLSSVAQNFKVYKSRFEEFFSINDI